MHEITANEIMCHRMQHLIQERSKYELSPERLGLKFNKAEVEQKSAEEHRPALSLPTEKEIYTIREKGRQTYDKNFLNSKQNTAIWLNTNTEGNLKLPKLTTKSLRLKDTSAMLREISLNIST